MVHLGLLPPTASSHNVTCFHGTVPPALPVEGSSVARVAKGQSEERHGARRQNSPLGMRIVLCKGWVKAEVEPRAFRNTDFVPTFGALRVVWRLLSKLLVQRTPSAGYTLFCSNLSAH